MTSPIETSIRSANQQGRGAFIPFMTAGFPSEEICLDLIRVCDDQASDVIEIGLPVANPHMDGPVIRAACAKVLSNGMTPERAFSLIAKVASKARAPLVLMTYVNPMWRAGLKRFAAQAKDAGVSGLIVPDLPTEEAEEWTEIARERKLDTIFMVAPTTPLERAARIAGQSKGFLYYVSTTGITGGALNVSEELQRRLSETRRLSPVPVAVGFGVSTPEQAAALADHADGVIVGTAFIRAVESETVPSRQVGAVSALASGIVGALKRGTFAEQKRSASL